MKILFQDIYNTSMEPMIEGILDNFLFNVESYSDGINPNKKSRYRYYLLQIVDGAFEDFLINYFCKNYELYFNFSDIFDIEFYEFVMIEDKQEKKFYLATNADVEFRDPLSDEDMNNLFELSGCKYFVGLELTEDETKELKEFSE